VDWKEWGPIPRALEGADWNINPAALPVQQVDGDDETEGLQVVPVYQGRLPEEDAAWDEWNPNISTPGSRASSISRNDNRSDDGHGTNAL
jgi:hypothetical protein